jgi:hypothetical protein
MRPAFPFLILAFLLFAPWRAEAQEGAKADKPAPIIMKQDVVYGRVHGAGLLADIAYPDGQGPYPVILSVHGGRWIPSEFS